MYELKHELPNGEWPAIDDVTELSFGGEDGRGGIEFYVSQKPPKFVARIEFKYIAEARVWLSDFLLRIKQRGDSAQIDRMLLRTRELRLGRMRPRPGETPVYLNVPKVWRLDQAVVITPRGCSLALASAIKGYNASMTAANLDVLLTLKALER